MNTIRRAEIKDIPGINILLGQVLYVHYCGRPDIFKEKGQKYSDEELKEILLNDVNPVFVCVDEKDKVLGHCFCQTIERPEKPYVHAYKTLFIDDLCVDENVRGQNIGTNLYNHVKQYAMENGYYNLTLHVWECNPNAVRFYRHLGMQVQNYTMEEVISKS